MKNCFFKLKEYTDGDIYIYECQHGTEVSVDSITAGRLTAELDRWGKLKCAQKNIKQYEET